MKSSKMFSGLFFLLFTTTFFVNFVMSSENNDKNTHELIETTVKDGFNYVATTPKILASEKEPSSYEKGEEDYEEAVARLEEEKEEEEGRAASQVSPIISIFQMFGKSMLSKVIEGSRSANDGSPIFAVLEVLTKSILSKEDESSRGSQKSDPMLSVVNMITDVVMGNQARHSDTNETSLVGSPRGDSGEIQNQTDIVEGRGSYIKGDPLNGYYDFLISEGSYKFWAVFQLSTAALIIYSTFAAIYYSKVNPLTSDYDYVDYLSRSFNGRSMQTENKIENSYWTSFVHGNWLEPASHAFEFILEAIDKVPQ